MIISNRVSKAAKQYRTLLTQVSLLGAQLQDLKIINAKYKQTKTNLRKVEKILLKANYFSISQDLRDLIEKDL